MKRNVLTAILTSLVVTIFVMSCYSRPNSDTITSQRQETLLMQAVEKIGMPAIKYFRELRMMNRVLEERDQTLPTWTYLWSDYNRCFTFIGMSVAYPIPYSTERTSPQKAVRYGDHRIAMPQADPNGLYPPSSAEGTFSEMNDPTKVNMTGLAYNEPRISTFPYELPERLVCPDLVRPDPKNATLKDVPKKPVVLSAPKKDPN
jgi:hypothetical protein